MELHLGAGAAAGRTRRQARSLQNRTWFQRFARSGIAARALIYALLAYFAADIALRGHSPANVSGSGALAEVSRQPGGTELLIVVAVGLIAYAAWRVTQAAGGSSRESTSLWSRIGFAGSGLIYLLLCWQALSLATSNSSGSKGAASHPAPLVATVLGWPAGPELVGAVAVGLAAGGVALAIWGCVHDFSKVLDTRQLRGGGLRAAQVTAAFGDVTRGLLIAAVGVYLMVSAVTGDPRRVKSLDAVLLTLARQPYGPFLLALVAAGFASFAVYSVLESRYRQI